MIAATAAAWRARAATLRGEQRMVEADEAITRAAALAPDDRLIAFLHAQSRYELGLPAAALFVRARQLWPDNPDVLRNHALALDGEGHPAEAQAVLSTALADQPLWLDGQRVLAALRWKGGAAAGFDAGFAAAVRAHPGHRGLWLGWFSAVAQTRDWRRARAILDEAERHLGPVPALLVARMFMAGEAGALAECAALLGRLGDNTDPFVQLARIRLALRRGDPAAALAVALPLTRTPLAGQVWPYVGTCWRLLGDPQAQWLEGSPPYIWTRDVGLPGAERTELAALLRRLHTARAPYADQSVRNGTQTDRSLLLRHEPILRCARAALLAVVDDIAAALPPAEAGHPLLCPPRERLSVSGSWSVRIGAGGHNVAHSHPAGWLSAVFYVALPSRAEMGADPAGQLQLGAPPAELGLGLDPRHSIAPVAGQLVVFPSTMWHGTAPIAGGERLNIAFDVVPAPVAS